MPKISIHLCHVTAPLVEKLRRQGMLVPGAVYGKRPLQRALQKTNVVHLRWVNIDPNLLGQLVFTSPTDKRSVPATVDLNVRGKLTLLRHRLTERTVILTAALADGLTDDPESEELRKSALRRRRNLIRIIETANRAVTSPAAPTLAASPACQPSAGSPGGPMAEPSPAPGARRSDPTPSDDLPIPGA